MGSVQVFQLRYEQDDRLDVTTGPVGCQYCSLPQGGLANGCLHAFTYRIRGKEERCIRLMRGQYINTNVRE